MPIKILNNSLINKIAAGEVIERPANVVKELLENSLDADATEIKIEIRNAGLTKIKVSDNGIGMNKDDLMLSCKRHATSKIKDEKDLNAINSLGFRGEALASIAEVSHLTIKTKEEKEDVGHILEIEGGIKLNSQKIGCSNGTIIEINNLFYNVPARKKFLKSPEVELAHIIDIVTRYALQKKEVSITLLNNKKEILNSAVTKNQLNNIIYIYGTENSKSLIEVDYKTPKLKIQGYISKPSLTRANKNEQSLYVNGRYVKSRIINEAIYSGYKTLLFTNRHPIYILNITIDPSEIDVNIHPNKLDIRIQNEKEVCETIFSGIKEALETQILIPTTTLETETKQKPTKTYTLTKDKQSNLFSEQQNQSTKPLTIQDTSIEQEYPASPPLTKTDNSVTHTVRPSLFLDFVILGQINKTFIIAETQNGLALIDQHAAQERVNYEKFLKELKGNALKKQHLLQPKIIELNPREHQIAITNKDFIEKLGFEIDDFGSNSIKLSSIPQIFGKLKTTLFIDIVNELAKINTSIINTEIEEKIIKYACRASIKAGDELTRTEMKQLLEQLEQTNNPYSCPHGRPTVIQLTNADLEKKFKRTGW
jgi:DNA mismatch repair protein MutL